MSLALTGIRTSGCMAECAVLCPLPQIMEKLRGKNTGTALIPCQGHSGPHSSYPEQYSEAAPPQIGCRTDLNFTYSIKTGDYSLPAFWSRSCYNFKAIPSESSGIEAGLIRV